MSLIIPLWVPEFAGERIRELHAHHCGRGDQAARILERLASYETMKTDVWEKLPSDSDRGQIVDWTFDAITIFARLAWPYPRKGSKSARTRWGMFREKQELFTDPAQLSWQVYFLWELMLKEKEDLKHYWPRFWEGDQRVTPESLIALLDALRAFFCKLNVEYREFLRDLPNVQRWNDKTPQKFLSDYLSARMKQTYARPMDPVVAALVGVVFDQENPAPPETIRGRRRLSHRKK